MKSELSNLIELQKTDVRIRQLKENIETADERRAALEEEFEKHASSIREIQNTRDEAQAKRAEFETKITEAKTGLKRANRNLKAAQDQQQYEAAMKEIASLDKQVSKHETGILENMETIEEAEKVLDERSDEVDNLESDWESKQAAFEKKLRSNKRESNKLRKLRLEVFSKVAPKLAAVYDRLVTRSRDGVGVAEVKDNACSACYIALRKQMVVNLKITNEIITCENCTRILYLVVEEEIEAATS